MREWLTVIIVLLIIGVLLDGLRRMRNSRRQSALTSLNIHKGLEKEDDYFGSELPGGGARVISKRDDEDVRALTQSMQEKHKKSKTTKGMRRLPQQVTLNLDEKSENGSASAGKSTRRKAQRVEPTFNDEQIDETGWEDEASSVQAETSEMVEDDPLVEEPQPDEDGEAHFYDDDNDPLFAEPRPLDTAPVSAQDELFDSEDEDTEEESQPDEVLVINVMAGSAGKFQGQALLDVSLECGLRFGDMQIFHRHEEKSGAGPLLFSMVNMVVPGTFDLSRMSEFETPGVSLFMTLPMKSNSVEAFNTMALTAATIAERLGGELKDETRSAMTNQTLEHCRQRIIEYERRRQLAASQ